MQRKTKIQRLRGGNVPCSKGTCEAGGGGERIGRREEVDMSVQGFMGTGPKKEGQGIVEETWV